MEELEKSVIKKLMTAVETSRFEEIYALTKLLVGIKLLSKKKR